MYVCMREEFASILNKNATLKFFKLTRARLRIVMRVVYICIYINIYVCRYACM